MKWDDSAWQMARAAANRGAGWQWLLVDLSGGYVFAPGVKVPSPEPASAEFQRTLLSLVEGKDYEIVQL